MLAAMTTVELCFYALTSILLFQQDGCEITTLFHNFPVQ